MALIYESPLFLEYRQGSLDRPPIPNYVHAHCEQCGDRAEWFFIYPLICKKWLTCNFSILRPYSIKQAVNENTQTYQEEVVILISHRILPTNQQGNL